MTEPQFQYNAFGLDYTDIVQAFTGAVSTNGAEEEDFATNYQCGRYLINEEIALQEGMLAANFNKITMQQLERLDWHEVNTLSISGNAGFEFDFAPDQTEDIKIYIDDETGGGVSETSIGCRTRSFRCGSFDLDDDSTELESSYTVAYDATRQKWVAQLNRPSIPTEDRILVSYTPDHDSLVIPSLKRALRDAVACVFGHSLYAEGDSTWALITRYCSQADSVATMIRSNRFLPPEIKRLRFVNPVVPTGIQSNKIWRN